MAIHLLEHIQVLPTSLQTCWDFFSDPRNLPEITPRELDFEVLTELPSRVYPGLMIEYRVRPLLRIQMKWLTEITHVEPLKYFVDEQRVGPYRIWHHEHHFAALPDGRVEVRDRVHYVLPFTPFSEIIHPLLVEPELRKIFAFRERAVRDRFGR